MTKAVENLLNESDDDVEHLIALLNVEPIGADLFRAASPVLRGRRNIFGGQVMAQALRAAGATVEEDRYPHSLHAYFLREGKFAEDVHLQVERTRDGKSFSTRQVTATQADGRAIFTLSASFHRDEAGRDFATPAREVHPPTAEMGPVPSRGSSIGIDLVDGAGAKSGAVESDKPAYLAWARTRGQIPEDRVLNACVLAYLSDLGTGGVAATAVGHTVGSHAVSGLMMASLDHSMWFHRPVRTDDWLLIDATPMSTNGSRGLIVGTVHDGTGLHAASFAQELLVREI
ncbi:acyl-CoA thioesterase [Jatrophihabitans sp. DSM 45814]